MLYHSPVLFHGSSTTIPSISNLGKLMNISFGSLNNSTVGNSTTFILTRRNMGKDTTVKVSA